MSDTAGATVTAPEPAGAAAPAPAAPAAPDPGGAAPAAGGAPAAPAATAPPAAPPAAPTTPSFDQLPDHMDRLEADPILGDQIKAALAPMRAEHQKFRETYGTYHEAFKGVDQGFAAQVLDMVKLVSAGQQDQARQLIASWGVVPQAPVDDPNRPLTRADIDSMLAERDHQAQQAATRAQREGELRQLGYAVRLENGKPDPLSAFVTILSMSGGEGGAPQSIQQAHDQVEGLKAQWAQEYLARKSGQPVPPPPIAGQPAAPGVPGGSPTPGRSPDAMCDHEDWSAVVGVGRITDEEDTPVTGYAVEVRANCTACGVPLIWHVPDYGMLPDRPTVSVDGQELRLPARPADTPEDFGLQLPGFSIRGFIPASGN
jgi:hypothetical protein